MAIDDQRLEVYRQHRTAQDKYVYFLLAAAGGAIAFSVNLTQHHPLAWTQLPLGVAVLLWGLSFFFGCRQLSSVQQTLYSNMQLLELPTVQDWGVGNQVQTLQAADAIHKSIKTTSDRSDYCARWQFGALIAGAICFLAWHVFDMYLKT